MRHLIPDVPLEIWPHNQLHSSILIRMLAEPEYSCPFGLDHIPSFELALASSFLLELASCLDAAPASVELQLPYDPSFCWSPLYMAFVNARTNAEQLLQYQLGAFRNQQLWSDTTF